MFSAFSLEVQNLSWNAKIYVISIPTLEFFALMTLDVKMIKRIELCEKSCCKFYVLNVTPSINNLNLLFSHFSKLFTWWHWCLFWLQFSLLGAIFCKFCTKGCMINDYSPIRRQDAISTASIALYSTKIAPIYPFTLYRWRIHRSQSPIYVCTFELYLDP